MPSRVDQISSGSRADATLSAELNALPPIELFPWSTTPPTPRPSKVSSSQALPPEAIDRKTLSGERSTRASTCQADTVLSPDIPGNNPASAMPESVDEAKALLATAGIDRLVDRWRHSKLAYRNVSPYKTLSEYLQSA